MQKRLWKLQVSRNTIFVQGDLIFANITTEIMSIVQVTTESGYPQEEKVKNILENILTKHDLSPYAFTDAVRIKNNAIPHSHPVLTLNTRQYDENHILSLYLHEQLHWFFEEKEAEVEDAIADLCQTYPKVPVGVPEGAHDEYSTYLHLLLLPLEYRLTEKFIGETAAKEVFEDQPVYWWIRRTTVNDYEFLMALIKKHGLDLE